MVTELKINSRKIQNCTTSTELFNFRTLVLNHFHGINTGQGQNKLPITLKRFNTLYRGSLTNSWYTMGLITNTFSASNISIAIEPYNANNTYIYKIVFDLSESAKKSYLMVYSDGKLSSKSWKITFFAFFPWLWPQLSDRIDLWIRFP